MERVSSNDVEDIVEFLTFKSISPHLNCKDGRTRKRLNPQLDSLFWDIVVLSSVIQAKKVANF